MKRLANPDFAECVTASFDKQNAMQLIRATLPVVEQGRTEIHVPHWDAIDQSCLVTSSLRRSNPFCASLASRFL